MEDVGCGFGDVVVGICVAEIVCSGGISVLGVMIMTPFFGGALALDGRNVFSEKLVDLSYGFFLNNFGDDMGSHFGGVLFVFDFIDSDWADGLDEFGWDTDEAGALGPAWWASVLCHDGGDVWDLLAASH